MGESTVTKKVPDHRNLSPGQQLRVLHPDGRRSRQPPLEVLHYASLRVMSGVLRWAGVEFSAGCHHFAQRWMKPTIDTICSSLPTLFEQSGSDSRLQFRGLDFEFECCGLCMCR